MATTKTAPKLPDLSEFAKLPTVAPVSIPMGTPIGLDVEQWAYAWIDLRSREDRVAKMRRRFTGLGYRVATGYEVAGVPEVELYVQPRSMYIERMGQRKAALRAGASNGSVSEFAVDEPKVVYRAPRR